MIDVLVASDIRIYCEGLSEIIGSAPNLRVIGTVSDRDAVLESISNNPPQVILLDMTMSSSCNLARQISRAYPEIKKVALAMSYDENNIVKCAEAGIICYVPREASVEDLIDAILEAARGECYCPPKIAACLLQKMQRLTADAASRYGQGSAPEPGETAESLSMRRLRLTRREQQIAGLLAEGMSNKQIARRLCIEVSTVKNHVHNVLVKLEVKNRSQAGYFLLDRFANEDLNPSI